MVAESPSYVSNSGFGEQFSLQSLAENLVPSRIAYRRNAAWLGLSW
jgi:hypothetical protein